MLQRSSPTNDVYGPINPWKQHLYEAVLLENEPEFKQKETYMYFTYLSFFLFS